MARHRLQISGVVQGVGFRPHVYKLAQELNLTGFVGNDSTGVFLEIQGEAQILALFRERLEESPPPAAHIESVRIADVPVDSSESAFLILHSEDGRIGHTSISPDLATCSDCLSEMLDPGDRRYRYPFINCTNCGPRFTIILSTPYDRPQTTMAGFEMCVRCQSEYDSPSNRRFHAQPNACPDCGPRLVWTGSKDLATRPVGEEALQSAHRALREGQIVAIKGIGGFHLAVDATNAAAVDRLRLRKHRFGKPLAIMVRDLEMARNLALVSDAEARLLTSPQHPIVLLTSLPETSIACQIAPGTNQLGVMLPYSGLHTLLMENSSPLVMTSGNLSDEPIMWRNEDALVGLAKIADGFLFHDRGIHVPCDDSVVRVSEHGESPIRRSRGYAPLPVQLRRAGPVVLAVGAELKSTFCLTKDDHAFLSQHIGDMESYETLAAFERALRHFKAIFRAKTELIACDLHPGYLSSNWARKFAHDEDLRLVEVQHHHAHLCSAMAEHGLDGSEPILAVVFDGTGYGHDGAIWGGEVLLGNYDSFERMFHLGYTPMPGGDASIRHPYRMALSHLWTAGVDWTPDLPCVAAATANEIAILRQQLTSSIHTVPTSSIGRLYDAVSSLIGIRQNVEYEAQAAIELEATSAAILDQPPYPVLLNGEIIDPAPIIRALVEERRLGIAASVLAARFQRTVVEICIKSAVAARASAGINTIALTGGVWQNQSIAALSASLLMSQGFRVLQHSIVPANDGGIALGQAAVGLQSLIGSS